MRAYLNTDFGCLEGFCNKVCAGNDFVVLWSAALRDWHDYHLRTCTHTYTHTRIHKAQIYSHCKLVAVVIVVVVVCRNDVTVKHVCM